MCVGGRNIPEDGHGVCKGLVAGQGLALFKGHQDACVTGAGVRKRGVGDEAREEIGPISFLCVNWE